jgi:ParB family chromosome partitioning protein
MAKKAFDLGRDSVYTADPATQLRIVGGRVHLTGDELGELDDDRTGHTLYDRLSLTTEIDEDEIANVDAFGVLQPIIVAKDPDDGLANVVVGRGRVRKARLANIRRAARGMPLIKIRCISRSVGDLDAVGVIISENEHRRVTSVLEKIEKAKLYQAIGADNERIAQAFRVKPKTVIGWLAFDENAIKETKAAVSRGDLSASAAGVVAAIRDPEKQAAELARMLAAPGKKTVVAARKAAAAANGKPTSTVLSKRALAAVLEVALSTTHPNATDRTLGWWDGLEIGIRLALGEQSSDQRVTSLLQKAGL